MTDIINAFMEAKTTARVTDMVITHHKLLDEYPFLWTIARNARRRIMAIERQKKLSWSDKMN
jgi:hypothetical protein